MFALLSADGRTEGGPLDRPGVRAKRLNDRNDEARPSLHLLQQRISDMKHLLSGVAILAALALAAPASAQRSGPGPGAWTGTGPGVIPPGGPGPHPRFPTCLPALPVWQHLGGRPPGQPTTHPLRIMLRLIIRHRLATTMGRRRVEAAYGPVGSSGVRSFPKSSPEGSRKPSR